MVFWKWSDGGVVAGGGLVATSVIDDGLLFR
jgi:hypothetical protein